MIALSSLNDEDKFRIAKQRLDRETSMRRLLTLEN
jgi:hypothetical protein